MKTLALTAACALAVLLTTSPSQAKSYDLPENLPEWAAKELKNEGRKTKLRKTKMAGGDVEVKLTGKITLKPTEVNPGVWFVQSNFGSKDDVQCWIITEPRQLNYTLTHSANLLMETVKESNDNATIGFQQILSVESGFLNSHAYAGFARLSMLQAGEQGLLQLQKTKAAQRDGVTFLCDHSELGYFETFDTMFENLIETAKIKTTAAQPYYTEKQLVMANGEQVGFAQINMTLDADGDTQIDTVSGALLSPDGKSIVSIDSELTEYSYPDGNLINAQIVNVENGQLTREMSFAKGDEDGVWAAFGTEGEEEVEHRIETSEAVKSTLGQTLMAMDALADGSKKEFSYLQWAPDIDATKVFTSTMTINKRATDNNEVTSLLGPLNLSMILDDSASALSSSQNSSGVAISTKRVSTKGSVRTAGSR